MISNELKALAERLDLRGDFELRVAFAVACVDRVRHLLIDDTVIGALDAGERFVRGEAERRELDEAARAAADAARSHAGTNSLDGSGSAAVSASHGVAAALAGRALDASGYAAYASVYSYASHAVTDKAAYGDEHGWQVGKLRELSGFGGENR